MKTVKKLLSFIVAILLCMTVFSACEIYYSGTEKIDDVEKTVDDVGKTVDDGDIICKDCGITHEVYAWSTLDEYYEMREEESPSWKGQSPPAEYFANTDSSRAVYDSAITYFRTIVDDSLWYDLKYEYSEDFGGVFIDNNGFYNICVVGDRTPVISHYIIYKQVTFSHNFLYAVSDKLSELMLGNTYTIWSVGIRYTNNEVQVSLANPCQIHLIVARLKEAGLYAENSIRFIVGVNRIVSN